VWLWPIIAARSTAIRKPSPLVIAGATLIPMDGERRRRGLSVLIEDGTIVAIAPAAELAASGAETLDATGMFLVPGLCDMHVHYWEPLDANLFLASGVTLVRNMSGSPFHLDLRRRVERGELAGPRLVTTSPMVDGLGEDGATVWRGAASLVDPLAAAGMVAGYAAQGYEQIKAYSWLRADVLRALGRAADAAGLRLTGHCPEGVSYEEAIAAGMSCFEHLAGIERCHLRHGLEFPPQRRRGDRDAALRRLRLGALHLDPDGVRRLGAAMAARQVWNCPTLVQQWAMAGDPAVLAAERALRYQAPARVASWLERIDGGAPDEVGAARRLRNARLLEVVAILHAEGAPLLLGTDTPNPFVLQGQSVHDELDRLAGAGLTPYQALRCATSEAARFLSAPAGTIAPGRRSDLVLTRSDPLLDLTALRRPEAVFVNGHRLLRPDLDRLLAARAAWAGRTPRPS
jgi:imidazolonepropionase-like amidohydrolase